MIEVRITQLIEGVYYAVVVTDGPAGRGEVDARPSDALNLALVVGAPIRIDARILPDQKTETGNEWLRDYPTSTADLAARHGMAAQDPARPPRTAAGAGGDRGAGLRKPAKLTDPGCAIRAKNPRG